MSERQTWHIPPSVEVDGRPVNLLRVAVFFGAFLVLCAGIYVWRRIY